MHPYYGTDRLAGASPTLVESVDDPAFDLAQTQSLGPQPQHQAVEPGDLQILQNLTLTQPTPTASIILSGTGSTSSAASPGVPSTSRTVSVAPTGTVFVETEATNANSSTNMPMAQTGQRLMGIRTMESNSLPQQYNYNSVSTSYSMPVHGPNGFGALPAMYMPVATSTPFVQFTTPIITYTQTSTSYTPHHHTHVGFNFSSPTFSTPPIQMMAPQAQVGILSPNSTSTSWQHKVPTSMPWAGCMTDLPLNIEFTATGSSESTPSERTRSSSWNGRRAEKKVSKRKSSVLEYGLPEKVHINEERMAAHLQELHLDNNNLQWHPDLEEQWYTQQKHKPSEPTGDSSSTGDDDDQDEEDDDRSSRILPNHRSATSKKTTQSRLEFSGMLQMGIKSRDLLPKVILDEINKPCMQVVLWKPPGNFVADFVRDTNWVNSPSDPDTPASDEMSVAEPTLQDRNADLQTSMQHPFVWKCHDGKSSTEIEDAGMDDMEL